MNDYGSGPTADDYRDFGEDLVQFAQRAAAPIVRERVGQLEHQVGQLHTTLNQERVERALIQIRSLPGGGAR